MNARFAFGQSYRDGPRLLADIGHGYVRFALEHGPGRIGRAQTLACADYPRFVDAVRAYLTRHADSVVSHFVIAIASPVDGDVLDMGEHAWQISVEATRIALGLDTLLVVNEFAALTMALSDHLAHRNNQLDADHARL
ncbi:MAG: glucokinase [Pseudomonadota bacterium]